MKALVYHGSGRKAWEEVPDPRIIDPPDVIVAVAATTIRGTDLHIPRGDVPAVTDGRILGHDGVGTITEVGQAVSRLAVGDRVIISCGICSYCHQQLPVHCPDNEGASGIGWILGHLINGTRADDVRGPFAENSLHRLPNGVADETAVMLSDILPTGFEIGVRNGRVKPDDDGAGQSGRPAQQFGEPGRGVPDHELGPDPAVRIHHAHRVRFGGPVDTDVEQHLLQQRHRCLLHRHPRPPHRGSDDPTRRPITGRSLTGAQRRRVSRLPVTRRRKGPGAAGVTRAVKRRPPRALSRRVPPTNTPSVLATGSVDQ